MTLQFTCAATLLRSSRKYNELSSFLQQMINRIGFGYFRYGGPDKKQHYMTRMELELKAYKKTGNRESLINLANYAFLESLTPENPKFHFDNTVASVTRGKIALSK